MRDQLHWNPKFIVNVDETHFRSQSNGSSFRVVRANDSSMSPINKRSRGKDMTAVPFVTGDGTVLLVVYILPWMSQKKEISQKYFFYKGREFERRGPVLNRAYVWNKRGWITLDIWKKIIKLFIEKTRSYFNGQTAILIMDRLAAHMNPSVLAKMMSSNLRSLFIPVKSSHFLQPLDNIVFAIWKRIVQTILTRIDLVPRNNSKPMIALEEVVMTAESKAFQKSAIIASFRNTGISPLSWPTIKKNSENAQKMIIGRNSEINVTKFREEHLTQTFSTMLDKHHERTVDTFEGVKLKKRKVTVERGKLMDDVQIIAFSQNQERARKIKEELKKERAQQRRLKREKKMKMIVEKKERVKIKTKAEKQQKKTKKVAQKNILTTNERIN